MLSPMLCCFHCSRLQSIMTAYPVQNMGLWAHETRDRMIK